jgi:uncharacterized OB-fold protein
MYGDGSQSLLSADGKPLPRVTSLNQKFWDLTRRSIFSLQTCSDCGHQHVPESPVCPRCLSPNQDWRAASGQGTLESWVDFHRAYWEGFKMELPYRVCLVRLAEGPLFVSNLVGEQGRLRIGAAVRVVFKPATEAIVLPTFSLV